MLCVVDGSTLRYYDNNSVLPTNLRFDFKQQNEYYFRDINSDISYCVFGRQMAKRLFPRLDEIDAPEVRNLPILQSFNKITITDGDTQSSFPNYDFPIEIRTYKYVK